MLDGSKVLCLDNARNFIFLFLRFFLVVILWVLQTKKSDLLLIFLSDIYSIIYDVLRNFVSFKG